MNIREEIIDSVFREIVGPSNNPFYLDEETNEEILLRSVHGSPKSRYGAGMLYPQQSLNSGEVDSVEDDSEISSENEEENGVESHRELEKNKRISSISGQEQDEEPVGMANQYLPSAMGFTVRFRSQENNDKIKLKICSAFYEKGAGLKAKKHIDKEGNVVDLKNSKGNTYESEYWIRRPILPEEIELSINKLFNSETNSYNVILKKDSSNQDWLKLRVFNRTTKEDKESNLLTFTFVLINASYSSTDDALNSNKILFQNQLILFAENPNLIAPYKEKHLASDTDEDKVLNLLYRKKRIFSIGHGTSVTWELRHSEDSDYESVEKIKTSVIPVHDLPQIAPTSHVSLSMFELSDLGDWDKGKESLILLKNEYENWINKIDGLTYTPEFDDYREAAQSNVEKCKVSLSRITKGIDLLLQSDFDSDLIKCFRWMNRAMVWQQQRSKVKIRKWYKSGTGYDQKLFLDFIDEKERTNSFESLKEFHEGKYNGKWRPFQLAFVLMNIESVVNSGSKERGIVDLIWFPTGGGKTEAYLGLTAFNIFFRRIKGKVKSNWDYYSGTAVLMRYTLRLLTTQQYERAASLICACDLIRLENIKNRENNFLRGELGEEPISIGLWVGSSSTPNKNDAAIAKLKKLKRDSREDYNFVVMKCPCCGAQIGKVENISSFDKVPKIKGIHKEDGNKGKVYFQCENKYCEYSEIPLPLQVIDEVIYNNPPTLLLGTVDKFAMIPWKEEAGNLFGFRKSDAKNMYRICPPELIIQDELHLIAGPLGTMVGLYETMVQTLCNNYKNNVPPFITNDEIKFVPPKIIASSATISRAYEQVKNLYGINNEEQLSIFPAQGLEFGDTWFSEEKSLNELDEEGNQIYPGRKYIGILASGYPSAQTSIVRTYATVLQKIKELSLVTGVNSIDYYWTLLGYFNSIRELGGASSLVYGDIKERLGQIQNRDLIGNKQKRYLNRIEELTSRISSAEIPATLKKLETKFSSDKTSALDICLATNMVATGVDVSRLGLMFIHGQPKTTAEYIQASSRVGRNVPFGPGMIFTLYSPSKPRDKSQYEQFQGFHSRIYANVEPTSVTPFSINARQKGLHAVFIGLMRHFSAGTLVSHPIISEEFGQLAPIIQNLIKQRCINVNPEEVANTEKLLKKRIDSWKVGGAEKYGDAANYYILKKEGYYPLMYSSSSEVREDVIGRNTPFATATSMRGVDTESVLSINLKNEDNE
ncbi:helicase-related protein [Maribacter sp. Asnod2-G09]|uniref:helicase-related protein n=1 Tax=Maribacter sp. Asnod2-G09 TaxID=3160577 RepID=UPI0038702A1F